MEDKDFIKEKIVGQRPDWKKRGKKAFSFFFSGILFGFGVCLVLFLLLPRLPIKKEQKETVALEEESTAAESSTEESEAIEDVVQSEIQKFDFPVSAYESMMGNLKAVIQEGEKSLVDVEVVTGGEHLLTEGKTRKNGLVFEKTSDAFLIVYPGIAEKEGKFRVRFYREKEVEASLVSMSRRDNLSVLSVPLSAFSDKELEKVAVMKRGNSRLLQRGETLVGIGSPSGQLYSTLISYVSYLSYEAPEVDRFMEEIAVQGEKSGEGQVFYLDTNGAWVGFSAGEEASFPHLYGISDYLDSLEALSNGKSLAYLGLRVQNATKSMVKLGVPEGIYISEVEEGSPAFSAGVQAGDILKKVDGKELPSVKDFEDDLLKKNPGDTVRLTVLRNNGNAYVDLEFSCPLETR